MKCSDYVLSFMCSHGPGTVPPKQAIHQESLGVDGMLRLLEIPGQVERE